MREWLKTANAMNPQARMVCGFQPPFEADYDMMLGVLKGVGTADSFELIFDTDELTVFQYVNRLNPGRIRMYDIKYIADLTDYESWLVVQGLIAVNRDDQILYQVKRAKRMLIQAIRDIWGIELQKKGDIHDDSERK